MESLIVYFIPTLLALGIVTSYEDLTEGKIRNKYLAAAALVGLITYLILIGEGLLRWSDFSIQMMGLVAAGITSVFIWYIKWWSAGDAKLFMVYFLLIPLGFSGNHAIGLQILILIAAIVIPAWVILLIRSLAHSPRNIKRHLLNSLNPREISEIILLVLSVPWILKSVFLLFNVKINFLISISGVILIGLLVKQYFPTKELLSYAGFFAVRIVFDFTGIFTMNTLLTTIPILIIYTIVRHLAVQVMIADIRKPKSIKENRFEWLLSRYSQDNIPFAPSMMLGVFILITAGQVLESMFLMLLI